LRLLRCGLALEWTLWRRVRPRANAGRLGRSEAAGAADAL